MIIDTASKIVDIWGKHIEYCSKLHNIFVPHIPESFLPFPKEIIEEASNIITEQHYKNGDKGKGDSIKNTESFLLYYINDEEAILKSAKLWNESAFREVMLPALKESQKNWIKTQNIDLEL